MNGPILRIFEVKTKPDCADLLLSNFATISANVVKNEPGNKGYFFGSGIQDDDNMVMFVSLWQSLDAVKNKFGENWRESYLPEGYEDLIEECSIRHIDASAGWKVGP